MPRPRADGGTCHQVKWRLGGSRAGAWQTETLTSKHRAESFREDVEAAGHQWPEGWIKGHGYLADLEEPPPPVPTFAAVAEAYFTRQEARTKRGKIKGHTLQRDRRTCEMHLAPTFGAKAFIDIESDDVEAWIDAQLDAGSAPKTIRNWHGPLATGARWGESIALRVGDATVDAAEQTVVLLIQRAWSQRAGDDPAPIDTTAGETRAWARKVTGWLAVGDER